MTAMDAFNRREFLRTGVIAFAATHVVVASSAHAQSLNTPRSMRMTASTTARASLGTQPEDNAVRPFRIDIPEEALVDLRGRLAASRWPDTETVADQSQGVQLATIQELA